MQGDNIHIHRPKDWQSFERFCRDFFSILLGDIYIDLNGVNGQQQHGIDIIINRPGGVIGVQCKGRGNGDSGFSKNRSISSEELLTCVRNARSFTGPVSQLIIVTSGENNSNLKNTLIEINSEHRKLGIFSVELFAWDWIESKVGLDNKLKDLCIRYGLIETISHDGSGHVSRRHKSKFPDDMLDTKIFGQPIKLRTMDGNVNYVSPPENMAMRLDQKTGNITHKIFHQYFVNIDRFGEINFSVSGSQFARRGHRLTVSAIFNKNNNSFILTHVRNIDISNAWIPICNAQDLCSIFFDAKKSLVATSIVLPVFFMSIYLFNAFHGIFFGSLVVLSAISGLVIASHHGIAAEIAMKRIDSCCKRIIISDA
ncbi:hypothetical protein AZA_32109 [Nitrospirillum viridazoti Y2]|uniref:Restriction endonuclease n=1 Tax=Nitrospirillum amazonense TaxID=28077 RepID=A0A560IAR5_9PROT|nr:hypothetical protein [Nitrospirillum amazonense]EGY02524.1 hypothetical protein AZA_32109 [Nitrospirillum amazonense Y2]TWB56127.1 hypothetical protein FBZ92_113121 [Nitrospirillum amazonense]